MGMTRHALWLDIRRAIARSRGRFLSIVGLMALGSFALVGLFVTGPDMRATGTNYFTAQNAADLIVIGDFGLADDDIALIEQADGIRQVEYGYLKDAVVDGTDMSLRIQSAPDEVSRYEVVEGSLPAATDEIALDAYLADDYDLGDTLTFSEKPDTQGDTVLTETTFTVVGFVNSPEIISGVNMGASTAGSGRLEGYAVVEPAVFDSDVYMTARLTFEDTAGLDPYSDTYAERVHAHRDELADLLADQPGVRLAEVVAENQETIDEGQAEVDAGRAELADAEAALTDARGQLDDAQAEVAASEDELADQTAAAEATLAAGASELAAGKDALAENEAELAQQEQALADAQQQVTDGAATLDAAKQELAEKTANYEAAAVARPELEAQLAEVESGLTTVDQALGLAGSTELTAAQAAALVANQASALFPEGAPAQDGATYPIYTGLAALQANLAELDPATPAADVATVLTEGLTQVRATLAQAHTQLEGGLAALDAAASDLAAAQDQIAAKEAELAQAEAQVEEGERTLATARAQLDAAAGTLADKQAELDAGYTELADTRAVAEAQIAAAKDEIAAREADYQKALDAYEDERPGAEETLAQAEADLAEAREKLERLEAPGYDVDTRRELPGGDGYKIYATVADIVDALARVFPVLLYFIAALVTFTTMTRMVDEERIGAGTLKALGYSDADVALKFVVYGLVSSMAGTLIGIIAGHTLFPYIVYNAYATKFVLPPITLTFDPAISLVAIALGLASAVLPAWLAAKQELRAKPSELLLPKPPAAGSKILLERIPFIWNRLDFTHKVTARNLFRYKKRMLMTIFGVAGAVVLLVAGFGTQYSISGISDEQFGRIVTYDMIVAQSATATDAELAELDDALAADDVARTMPIHYESLSQVAGANQDTQDITLIVPDDPDELARYITLQERVSGEAVPLDADACVLSERLAQLLGVTAGGTFTVNDATGGAHTLTCTGVTEMYMGHFIFMGKDAYAAAFGTPYAENAHLVTLADSSTASVDAHAAALMELPAVAGIVQNSSLIAQIATIVDSLDKIMVVLIVVATLLAAVILYNLTTINVSERIRELSTIKVLGFFDGEVTMYIYRETILLTALGILVGYGLGVWFRNYIITVVPPDNVMFDPSFAPYVFIIPLVIVGAITALLGLVVHRRLRDVDMLEALKSVE